jgi:translation initiation factor 4G
MNFSSFFALLFPEWVYRFFNSVKSISQSDESDSHLLPESHSGSQMSYETNTDIKPQEPIGQLPETQSGSQMSYETNTTDTCVGHQYQQMTIDAVLEEEKHLRERLRVMTRSRDALLIKNRRMKCQANSRISTWRQLECKMVSLEDDIMALRESVNEWQNQAITSDKELHSLKLAHSDQEELINNLKQTILDLQTGEHPKKESCSLSRTYNREFLLSLNNIPVEITREVAVATKGVSDAKRNASPCPSIQSIGAKVTEAPRREFKLAPIDKERQANDSNVWRPSFVRESTPGQRSTEMILKTVRGLLNKLTPANHDKLFSQIQALDINNEERLAGVITLFFEKALSEPCFAPIYARMCQALSEKAVYSSTDPEKSVSFRTLLLAHCKNEFDKDSAELVGLEEKRIQIRSAETEERKKELTNELQDLVDRNRRKVLGNITLIGELFRVGTISNMVIHQCIRRLLKDPDDEQMENLCLLMKTVGKEFDTIRNSEAVNSYFRTLEWITVERKSCNRIRFMVMDLSELRSRRWTTRQESTLEDQNISWGKTQQVTANNITEETTPQQLPVPVTVIENNMEASVLDPIPAQERTKMEPRQVTPTSLKENTVKDKNHRFTVVASPIRVVEMKNEIVLRNVEPSNYGRIIGREGSNLQRLLEEYGTVVTSKNKKDGNYDFTFSGSTIEGRRQSVDDVIESLPVMIEFDYSTIHSLKRTKIKKIAFFNFVQINIPKLSEEKVTMCGTLNNCEKVFHQLVNLRS